MKYKNYKVIAPYGKEYLIAQALNIGFMRTGYHNIRQLAKAVHETANIVQNRAAQGANVTPTRFRAIVNEHFFTKLEPGTIVNSEITEPMLDEAIHFLHEAKAFVYHDPRLQRFEDDYNFLKINPRRKWEAVLKHHNVVEVVIEGDMVYAVARDHMEMETYEIETMRWQLPRLVDIPGARALLDLLDIKYRLRGSGKLRSKQQKAELEYVSLKAFIDRVHSGEFDDPESDPQFLEGLLEFSKHFRIGVFQDYVDIQTIDAEHQVNWNFTNGDTALQVLTTFLKHLGFAVETEGE